jgi:hypothetical protein
MMGSQGACMAAIGQAQVCAAINSSGGLRGVGIIQLGDQGGKVLQRSQASTYLVLVDPSPGGRLPQPNTLFSRLRGLGINPNKMSLTGSALAGSVIYAVTAGGTSDMVAAMTPMNVSFLALQQALQMESRKFQNLSNASKTRHDLAMNAIRNTK